MRIVAFLQNQWFKDPKAVKTIYDRHPDCREDLNKRFLFLGCVTGRRLKKAFEELCNEIVWEEISTQFGGKSSSIFPPDHDHIRRVLDKHKPTYVLVFGKAAMAALKEHEPERMDCQFFFMPHPAARHASVQQDLDDQARLLRACMSIGQDAGAIH